MRRTITKPALARQNLTCFTGPVIGRDAVVGRCAEAGAAGAG